jgi:hypothetical protein
LNHFTRGFYDERLRIKDVTHEAVQVWHWNFRDKIGATVNYILHSFSISRENFPWYF